MRHLLLFLALVAPAMGQSYKQPRMKYAWVPNGHIFGVTGRYEVVGYYYDHQVPRRKVNRSDAQGLTRSFVIRGAGGAGRGQVNVYQPQRPGQPATGGAAGAASTAAAAFNGQVGSLPYGSGGPAPAAGGSAFSTGFENANTGPSPFASGFGVSY